MIKFRVLNSIQYGANNSDIYDSLIIPQMRPIIKNFDYWQIFLKFAIGSVLFNNAESDR